MNIPTSKEEHYGTDSGKMLQDAIMSIVFKATSATCDVLALLGILS